MSRELVRPGQRCGVGELGGQGGLGFGQLGEARFPAGFQAAGHEPVLRLAGAEGALGPVGLVAGPLDGEFSGAGGPLAAVGDLPGGGDGQLQFCGRDRGEQRPGHGGVDGGSAGVLAAGGGLAVRAGPAGVVGAAVVVVADAHVPAAAAVDDALAQRAAFAGRAGAAAGLVGGHLGLDGQVVLPGDVSLVVIADQHLPLVAGHGTGAGAHAAAGVDLLAGAVAAERVGAGVDRVMQQVDHPGVAQPSPGALAVPPGREPAAGERGDDPVGRPGRGERGEHVADRGGDLLVGVLDHLPVLVDVADRERQPQVAAGGGGHPGTVQPGMQQVQLGLAHLALEAQQQPVVDVGQVVDAVRVDDQRAGDPGDLQQPRQVGIRAGQPGDLQPEDRAGLAGAHPSQQVPEALTVGGRAAGQPQVAVDHLDPPGRPAEPGGLAGQAVLPGGGLAVLADLRQRGLAQVDHRRPAQVLRGDLLLAPHHRRPPAARAAPARLTPGPARRPAPPPACSPAPRSSRPAHRRRRRSPSPAPRRPLPPASPARGGPAAPG